MPPCWKDNWITTKEGNKVNIGKDCGKQVAIVAAILVAAAVSGGVAVAAAIAVEVSGAGATASAAEQSVTARTARARASAARGRYAEAWQRLGVRRVNQAAREGVDCVVYSTGRLRDFFLNEPCLSLKRRLEVLADEQGQLGVVSMAWVRMYGEEAATRLQALAGTPGAGWVIPLGGELASLPEVGLDGENRVATRTGSLVRFTETVSVDGVDPELLAGAGQVASEFPEP